MRTPEKSNSGLWLAIILLGASGCQNMGDPSTLTRVPAPATGSYSSASSYYTPSSGTWSSPGSNPALGTGVPNATNSPTGAGNNAAGNGVAPPPSTANPSTANPSTANPSTANPSTANPSTPGTAAANAGNTKTSATFTASSSNNVASVGTGTNRNSTGVTTASAEGGDSGVRIAVFQEGDDENSKVVPASSGAPSSAPSTELPWRSP